jgi:hypothetical protein
MDMGFFTKADGAGAFGGDVPTPLTLERLSGVIESMEYQVGQEDGYLWGFWEGRYFDFRLFGEGRVFQVRAVWNGLPSTDEREVLVAAANEWNADRLFPKAFVISDEGGLPRVMVEINVPTGEGISDSQLADMVSCGLGTGEEFFASLDERFPDAVRRRQERAAEQEGAAEQERAAEQEAAGAGAGEADPVQPSGGGRP